MKKIFMSFLIALLGYTIECYSQRLTEEHEMLMTLLPRTADDFQSKFYDMDLISATSLGPLYFPLTEDIPITAHNGSITGLTFQIFQTIERFGEKTINETPEQGIKMDFTSSGKLINYVGVDKRNFVNNRFSLFSCVPFSTKLESGIELAESNGMALDYTKDTQNRVIEAQATKNGDPRLIFRYSYLGNTKKISTIKAYNSIGNLIGEVFYSYNNDKLSELYYKAYQKTPTMNALYGEYRKQYTYDEHGNYLKKDFWYWWGVSSSWSRTVITYENQYNTQGQLLFTRVGSSIYSPHPHGSSISPSYSTRKYTYDNMGNWVKIEMDDGTVATREFEYMNNTSYSQNDPNRIFGENEVGVRASFGQTVRQHVREHGLRALYPYNEDAERIATKTTQPVNVSFIVEKDGSLSNLKVFNQSEESRGIIYQATRFVKSQDWMPASVDGKPVRSEVYMSWYLNDNKALVVEKDVTVTNTELTAYNLFAKKKQFERTKKEALSGSVEAKKTLAKMYLDGNGTERNEALALEQYVDLAIKGDIESENYVNSHIDAVLQNSQLISKIGRSYKGCQTNLLIPSDKWAYNWCLVAMKNGNEEAKYEYALRCANGFARSRDVDEGIRILEEMASNGSLSAMSALGLIYYEDEYNRVNPQQSVYWAQRAADKGHPLSQFLMGKAYQNGFGVKKDKKLSFAMFEKAANQGNIKAIMEVVLCFVSGQGVKKDYDLAEIYFNKLPVNIQGEVADKVFWGRGTKKNKKMGLQLYAIAASNGNVAAAESYELWSK